MTESEQSTIPRSWQEIVARYQQPSVARGTYQLVNTLVPFVALWVLMYFVRPVSWWLVVPLAALAGAFLVRLFIIHHDCGLLPANHDHHGRRARFSNTDAMLGFFPRPA